MEAVRGVVEETVWQLTMSRTFRKADFGEGANGEVRLLDPLTHQLATALLPSLRTAVAPVAEDVAQTLLEAVDSTATVPTPLSRRNHRTRQAGRREGVRQERRTPPATTQLWSCPQCGGPVSNNRHVRCQD